MRRRVYLHIGAPKTGTSYLQDRLRLLALCSEEELTVGELATLLGESQPQVTKKSQPLREVGLLSSRRDGTRTLLRAQVEREATPDVIVAAAVLAGWTPFVFWSGAGLENPLYVVLLLLDAMLPALERSEWPTRVGSAESHAYAIVVWTRASRASRRSTISVMRSVGS